MNKADCEAIWFRAQAIGENNSMPILEKAGKRSRLDPFLLWLLLLTIILILGTRLITVTHNMELHPDEHVFFMAADSLTHFIEGTEDTFAEVKEYPEGAIVLQLPFHFAAAPLRHFTSIDLSMRLCSRLASIFYFTLGAALGLVIEYNYFGKSKLSAIAYSAVLIFSIMHLEQSRYGTGDAISMFLTMAILYLSALGEKTERKKKLRCWLIAGFLTGVLCAVKYPLVFWGLIPFTVAIKTEGLHRREKVHTLILFTVTVIVGFLFVSPKTALDPRYILRTVRREMYAYVLTGNVTEVGGPLNHFLSLTIYSLFYSGFPLAPVFFVASIKGRNQPSHNTDWPRSFLFDKLLPCLIVVFSLYNMFSKTMFMRTLYPFFFLSDLYVADYLGKHLPKGKRAILCILAGVFLLRGIYYVEVLTEKWGPKKLKYLISQAADVSWNQTTLLNTTYCVNFDREKLIEPKESDLFGSDYEDDSRMLLDPGELVITGGIEFYRGTGYFFAVDNQRANQFVERWNSFKRINHDYFVGAVYPTSYYYLFGYWLKGTSGSCYEFPANYVYYRS